MSVDSHSESQQIANWSLLQPSVENNGFGCKKMLD